MKLTKSVGPIALLCAAFALICLAQPGQCQSGSFSGSRPTSGIFEPTLSFIRQNLKWFNGYVALFRSIFVGAYERPLITSTDPPPTATRGQNPVVPAMDLPRSTRA